jgi:uncharacterized protein (TIGR03437 family)
MINTVAGTGKAGFSGDGGSATKATLNYPIRVAVDGAGNLFIVDANNNRVREVTADGTIRTVAGNGAYGFSGDGGLATSASLAFFAPVDVLGAGDIALDASGNLFIADAFNNRIRKIDREGIISTVAGINIAGFFGDGGLATNAVLNRPSGVATDKVGDLLIADTNNNRVRTVLAALPAVSVAPAQLAFSAASNGAPTKAQAVSLISPVNGVSFSVEIPSGIEWLEVNPSNGASPRVIQVTADPTNLSPGSYQTAIQIMVPNANPTIISIPVTFVVGPSEAPTLAIDKTNLSFPFSAHGAGRSQTILISNSGGGTLSFTESVTTLTGGAWLSVSPVNGQALPAQPTGLTVTADPTGLPAGTYSGQVTVTADTQTQSVPVTMTISALGQAILLSQTGLSFLGVSQGGVLPPQSFGVLNIGTDVVKWKASTSTLPMGGTWLRVNPTNGSTDAIGIVPTAPVSVNAASLSPGKHYGQVRVDAPGAANTPQVLTVAVQVLPQGSNTGAAIQPAELLFATAAGGESPGSQNLFVYNVAAAPKTFQASVTADTNLNLAILPSNATLDPMQPTRVVVQPFTNGLGAGTHTGVITFQFSDGNVLSVSVKVIVAAASVSGVPAERGPGEHKSDTTFCFPSKLVLASNTLAQSAAVPAGYPVGLEVNVKDDCGTALSSGSVTASFSNSDPELQLQSLKSGLWSATWQTSNSSGGPVTITLLASDTQGKLQGRSVVNTALAATTDQPVFQLQGVVSAAGGQRFVPIAPGSIISIYGQNLAGGAMLASSQPLPTQLVDTTVVAGSLSLPLYYVSEKQVNAQIPFDIDTNTTSQLYVVRGNAISLPVGVDVAPAQPSVFTDSSVAPNQGAIFVARGKEQFEAKPESPASTGDVIVMYCAGLGAVNPTIAAGAKSSGQTTKTTPTVMIGSQNASVQFSGLTPGLVGLYQINAVVPSGVPTGNAVPVTITIAGQTSPQVVMAIQ